MALVRVQGPINDIAVDGAGNFNFKLQPPEGYPNWVSAHMSYGGDGGAAIEGTSLAVGSIYTIDPVETYAAQTYRPMMFVGTVDAPTLPTTMTVWVELVCSDEAVPFVNGYGGTVVQV